MAIPSPTAAPVPLSDATLAALPADVLRPRYDRAALSPGIVHIGLGNFHRAHQAWYLHRLMQQGDAQDWAIVGAGVRAEDAAMRTRLLSQDCLTTLVELDPAGATLEVVGAMTNYLPVEPDNAALIRQMADPAIRIVSLTVTEGGYFRDGEDGFDAHHPDIRHDIAHPGAPRTAFGAMVAALALRRRAGVPPFTALSCDNLQGNGAILQRTVLALAEHTDPELARWIEAEGAFPNSMVDCIVPATTPDLVQQVRETGIADAAPVMHENFRQWVIEDRFCAGRPKWEEVGALITSDVHGHEAMKLRILNGGHQLLANVGEVLSRATIADCMADEQVAAFFRKVQVGEILPHVVAVPGTTPAAYLQLIAQRFANPAIRDATRRVAFDGSARHPGFLLPTVRDALAGDHAVSGLALAEAFWARMCVGEREDGSLIEANDPHWASLQAAARAAREEPAAWLAQPFYGDLAGESAFADSFSSWLARIWGEGCRAALDAYLTAS
ncbi:MAG: mannitol dehydrogenase family protein [Pseudomonadota bacterium]